jgi:HD-GYP domain-containing protein (c-di-GMP phosphodiesterase class II)
VLKKIPVRQLQLGMYLHSFEGNWVSHPFWRTAFVLQEEEILARARASSLEECWIDTSLGMDAASAPAAAPGPAIVAEALAPPPEARPMAIRTSLSDELNRAAKLCKTASTQVMHMFEDARLGRTLDAEGCVPLVHEISDSITRNPGALLSLARLKTQDDYSYMHSVAVCALMISLGRQLELDDAGCREAGMAGLLHDIGKAFIPAAILSKPGKLDDDEFAVIKTHPERGHELLSVGHSVAASALDVCIHHHERMDGKGYPHGLAGDDISLFARMGAVCDVYDAVTSDRPYKAGWDPADAIARMAQWEGHFDPAMIKALIHSLGIYPTGSLVRLDSQRIGVVVEQNAHALAKPVVKVFFSLKSRMPVTPELLDLAGPHCSDKVLSRENIDGWNQRDIAAMWAGDALPKGFKAAGRPAPRKMKTR